MQKNKSCEDRGHNIPVRDFPALIVKFPNGWLISTLNSPYQVTLDASGGIFLLVASSTVDFLLARNKRLGADGSLAHTAREALLVPLTGLVLHLLGS